jgi:hypothetical protein
VRSLFRKFLIVASIVMATALGRCAHGNQNRPETISATANPETQDASLSKDALEDVKDTLEDVDARFAACDTGKPDQGNDPECLKLGGFPAWISALKRAGAKDEGHGCVDDDGLDVCEDPYDVNHRRLDAYYQHVDRERRSDSKKPCAPDILVRVRLDETGRRDSYYADCGQSDRPNAVLRSITMATPKS